MDGSETLTGKSGDSPEDMISHNQESGYDFIHTLQKKKIVGDSISKVRSSLLYVFEHTLVDNVADYFNKHEFIDAVGVVDQNRRVKGLVTRKNLFELLSKPYARDVFKNTEVIEVTRDARVFSEDLSIFHLQDILKKEMQIKEEIFYILVTYNNDYAGIFSNRDLVYYLSEMTRKDINMARNLQMNIVQEKYFQSNANFEIAASSTMAKGVGGDFYIVKQYSDKRWFITLADVSGKGISASLVSAVLGGMTSIYNFNGGLKKYITHVNEFLFNTLSTEKFLTGIFIDYDDENRSFNICDMGHSYLYLIRDENVYNLKTSDSNLPLGIMANNEPVIKKFDLKKNDIFVMVTDGVVEQMNHSREEYSDKRLSKLIKEKKYDSLSDIRDALVDDVNRFKEGQPQHDDLTFILFKNK